MTAPQSVLHPPPSATSSITVRQAVPADAPMLALVGAATFLDGFADLLPGDAMVAHVAAHHTAEVFARYLASPGVFGWLATAAHGAPVGYSMLTPPELPPETVQPGDLELKRIYALSRFHGSGLAQRLLAPAIVAARSAGAPRLLLGVHAQNVRALRFYHRNGFRPVGARQFQVGTLLCDDLVLARPLA